MDRAMDMGHLSFPKPPAAPGCHLAPRRAPSERILPSFLSSWMSTLIYRRERAGSTPLELPHECARALRSPGCASEAGPCSFPGPDPFAGYSKTNSAWARRLPSAGRVPSRTSASCVILSPASSSASCNNCRGVMVARAALPDWSSSWGAARRLLHRRPSRSRGTAPALSSTPAP